MLLTRVITTNQELRNVINQSLSYICFTLSAVYMRCLIDRGQILFSFPVLISLNEVPSCFYRFFYLPPLFFNKDNLLFIFLVFIPFAELFRHQFSSEWFHILVACFLSLTSKLKSVSGVSHATDQSIKFKGWYGLRSGCRGKKHDISLKIKRGSKSHRHRSTLFHCTSLSLNKILSLMGVLGSAR